MPAAIAARSAAEQAVAELLRGVHLREPATEVDAGGARWELGVGQRVEDHRFAAGGAQQLVGLGIAKGERPTTGHGDDRPGFRRRTYGLGLVPSRCRPGAGPWATRMILVTET